MKKLYSTLRSIGSGCMAMNRRPCAIYVLSNQPSGNSVLVYSRAENGTLTYAATYSTGGKGADPRGSQGLLTLDSGFLLAVNAGSNDVSLFAIDGSKLTLLDRKRSYRSACASQVRTGGNELLVTEKGTQLIDTYSVGFTGYASATTPHA